MCLSAEHCQELIELARAQNRTLAIGHEMRVSTLWGKAKELIMTGDEVVAEEALKLGLVNQVVPPEQLSAAALAFAGKLVSKPPMALRLPPTAPPPRRHKAARSPSGSGRSRPTPPARASRRRRRMIRESGHRFPENIMREQWSRASFLA